MGGRQFIIDLLRPAVRHDERISDQGLDRITSCAPECGSGGCPGIFRDERDQAGLVDRQSSVTLCEWSSSATINHAGYLNNAIVLQEIDGAFILCAEHYFIACIIKDSTQNIQYTACFRFCERGYIFLGLYLIESHELGHLRHQIFRWRCWPLLLEL